MAEAGAVSELIDGEKPISITRAKWRNTIDALQSAKLPKTMLHLFQTMEEVDPIAVDKHAPSLWLALQRGDSAEMIKASHALMSQMTGKALFSADDEPLMALVKATAAELRYLRDNQHWKQCVGLIDGKGFGGVKPPPGLQDADFASQTETIVSAARNAWEVKVIPAWAKPKGEAMAAAIGAGMTADQLPPEKIDSDPRVSCEWSARLLIAISEQPESEGASIYRWLADGAK